MFSTGDSLCINIEYVKNILKKHLIKSTLDALSYLAADELVILQQNQLPNGLFFIQVIPKDNQNSAFHNGQGVTLFFPSQEHLFNSFTNLTQLRNTPVIELKAFNNYPKIKIPPFHLVKIIFYSKTIEAHIVEFAEENDYATAKLAITEELILPGLFGKITQIN